MAQVSLGVACSVIEVALRDGLTTKVKAEEVRSRAELESFVKKKMYDPRYVPLVDPTNGGK